MNSFLAYTDKQSYYPNEIINIYSHYPGPTSYTNISTSINFQSVFNSWTTNQKTTIIKQNNSLKVILNQTNSTPGILLPKIKVFSTGSITYTGSLFVDDNIYKLTTNVINNMLN